MDGILNLEGENPLESFSINTSQTDVEYLWLRQKKNEWLWQTLYNSKNAHNNF
jgi:hypothetical protein